MKRVSLKNEKKKGFTLVELIIVIAIIAILAAIAIPKFGSMRQTANVKADIATAKNIATIVSQGIADDEIGVNQTAAVLITALKNPSGGAAATTIVTANLDGVTTPKVAPKSGNTEFSVTISETGNIIVFVGGDQVYPTPSGNHA